MSEEQKRQWAMILWYHQYIDGPSEMGALMAHSGITNEEKEDILKIKNSFTEQPKP